MAFQVRKFESIMCQEKLSSLCLNCIIQNFKTFMTAYESGDRVPQKHFEFLQRTHSVTLLEELYDHDDFVKYSHFLLNPYLKRVDLERNFGDGTTIIKRLKDIGPTIISLRLAYADYSCNALTELTAVLPNAESITFCGLDISENMLRSIGCNCQALKTLSLSSCRNVTDKCIDALCFPDSDNNCKLSQNSVLEHLDIGETEVTVAGVTCALKNLKGLLSLNHENVLDAVYNLHYDDMKNNAICDLEKYNLETLCFNEMSSYPIEFMEVCATLFPNLSCLTVHEIEFQLQTDTLAKFTSLKEANLFFNDFSIDLLLFIKSRGNNLEKLCIGAAKLLPDSLIKFCPKLNCFELLAGEFLPIRDSVAALSNHTLHHLKKLTLHELDCEEENNIKAIKLILSCSPNLEMLDLSHGTNLSEDFIKSVIVSSSCINSLENIHLDSTDVLMSGAEELVLKATNLKVISFQDCYISIDEVAELKQLRPHIDIQFDNNLSDFSNPNEDDFDDYFNYNSDNSYDFSDYEDEPDESDYYGHYD